MAIQYGETGLTSEQFAAIFNAAGDFTRQLIVRRHTPDFALKNSAVRAGDLPFSVDADSTKLLRAYNSSGDIYVDYLLNEDAGTQNWAAASLISTGRSGLKPKVVKEASNWAVYFVGTDDKIKKASSTAGTGSWSVADWSTQTVTAEATHFTFAPNLAYYWQLTGNNAYELVVVDATTTYSTLLYWWTAPTSLDVCKFIDTSDDKNAVVSGSDVRHMLVFSAETPGLYTYELPSGGGTPVRALQRAGGVLGVVVRPPIAAKRGVQFSDVRDIHVFDKKTDIQYRTIPSIWSDGTSMWVSCYGSNGDINGSDDSFGTNSLFYYSSKKGLHWSQDRIVPLNGTVFADWAGGAQLVRSGDYLYMISSANTLRSKSPSEFGHTHPDWELDITPRVHSYSTSISEGGRQTNIVLDNRDYFYGNTILAAGAVYSLTTKIGLAANLVQVAIEEIDALSFSRDPESAEQTVSITARDFTARLTDRVHSADAGQYDTQVVGLDQYRETGGVPNSGLTHTATVKGVFGTSGGTLITKRKYQENIAFNTFKPTLSDGSIQIRVYLPDPVAIDPAATNGNNPTYAGVVFRAIDKDNFWYVKYDWWADLFIIGYRKNGSDMPMYTWACPSSWHNMIRDGASPAMRVEFRSNHVAIALEDGSDSLMHALGTYVIPGESLGMPPFQQGAAGVFGCGYTDEEDLTEMPWEKTTLPPLGGRGLAHPSTLTPGLVAGLKKMCAVFADGKIGITHNWENASPTWVEYNLALGTPVQFVVRAFSAGYVGSGKPVDGWVVTTTKIFFIADFDGARTVTDQFTFRATSSLRSCDASFGTDGEIAVRSTYADGEYETHWNGSAWTTETVVSSAKGARPGGLVVNPRVSRQAITTAINSGTAKGYRTANLSTYSPISTPSIDGGSEGPGEMHMPYHNNPNGLVVVHGHKKKYNPVPHHYPLAANYHWALQNGSIANYVDGSYNPDPGSSVYGYYYGEVIFYADQYHSTGFTVTRVQEDHSAGTGVFGFWTTLIGAEDVNNNVLAWFNYTYRYRNYSPAWYEPWVWAGSYTHPQLHHIRFKTYTEYDVKVYTHNVSVDIDFGGPDTHKIFKVNGSAKSDITPKVSDVSYIPWKSRWQIVTSPVDSKRIAVVGGNADLSMVGIWVSKSGGPPWTNLVTPTAIASAYTRVAVAGDGSNELFFFGNGGKIGHAEWGKSISNKRGNLADTSEIIGICGLP